MVDYNIHHVMVYFFKKTFNISHFMICFYIFVKAMRHSPESLLYRTDSYFAEYVYSYLSENVLYS